MCHLYVIRAQRPSLILCANKHSLWPTISILDTGSVEHVTVALSPNVNLVCEHERLQCKREKHFIRTETADGHTGCCRCRPCSGMIGMWIASRVWAWALNPFWMLSSWTSFTAKNWNLNMCLSLLVQTFTDKTNKFLILRKYNVKMKPKLLGVRKKMQMRSKNWRIRFVELINYFYFEKSDQHIILTSLVDSFLLTLG